MLGCCWLAASAAFAGPMVEGAGQTNSPAIAVGATNSMPSPEEIAARRASAERHRALMEYKFTNELGQLVSFSDFHGQALAVIFFFTSCPKPEFCPRLSKNFQEATAKLKACADCPTNWHFISVTFDPERDTPETLKAYGERYDYDPARWTFLTGPTDKIMELARQAGVTTDNDGGSINHNFRTLILDGNNHLRMVFPMGGDLSDAIVDEIRKAAVVPVTSPNADSKQATAGLLP